MMVRVGVRLSSVVFLCAALDVQAQNLIQNPGFTGDLSGWTIVPSGAYTVAWDGAQGGSAPGSVSLDLPSSAGSFDAFFLQQGNQARRNDVNSGESKLKRLLCRSHTFNLLLPNQMPAAKLKLLIEDQIPR